MKVRTASQDRLHTSAHRSRGVATPGLRALAGLALGLAAACADSPTQPLLEPPSAASLNAVAATVNEPFDAWDASLWSKGDHVLGLGYLDPANVAVTGGYLEIATPAGTRDGGEILSNASYGYGRYSARLLCRTPGGTVCAFFLYEGVRGKANDEIDIELIGATRELWFTTWVRGKRTNQYKVVLPFDPAAEFHTYTIENRASAVTFLVDGAIARSFTRKLPTHSLLVMANAWWPTWLSGTPTGGSLYLDSIVAEP